MATTITANGINFPDGSAGSPSIGGTDTNTGLFTGSDIVGFATGGSERLRIDASGNVNIANDSGKLQLGTSADLKLYHDGSNSWLLNDTGNLILKDLTDAIYIQAPSIIFNDETTNENIARFISDGACELYYDNSKKFETYQYGVNFSGTAKLESGGNFHAHDNVKFIAGTGEDLQIYHDGNNSQLQATGGQSLFIKNDYEIQFLTASNEKQLVSKANGAVELYYDDSKKLETTADGVILNGASDISHSNADNFQVGTGSGENGITIYSGTTNNGSIYFADGGSASAPYRGFMEYNHGNDCLYFGSAGGTAAYFDNNRHFLPNANDNNDMGSSSKRWRNIYTNDLNLSNEGGSNDVDSTWGSYTIQEGAEDLFLINRRNGKKYKFNLTEVS